MYCSTPLENEQVLVRRATVLGVSLVSFVVYLSTMAPGLTWAHHGADGGDLAAAIASGGIPHPPGYPTYVLMGRAFAALPVGSLAFRLNLMSAVCASATVALAFLVVSRLVVGTEGSDAAGGGQMVIAALAALTFALSPVFWSQAIITEVYALNALFVAVLLYMALRPGVSTFVMGLILGLGLGNHLSLALLVPTLAWLCSGSIPRRALVRHGLQGLVGTLAGLLVYLYLPLQAHADPLINWGDPQTPERFLWVVSGGPYRDYVFALPLRDAPARLGAWAGLVVGQFGWVGVVLMLLGLWDMLTTENVRQGWGLVLAFGLYTVYAVGYRTHDSFLYLIPAFMISAIWVGRGMALVIAAARSWAGDCSHGRRQIRRTPEHKSEHMPWLRAMPVLAALALALLPITQWQTHREAMDLSQDVAAEEYTKAVFATVPANGLIITASDEHTFSLWYAQVVSGRRDLLIVDRDLTQFAWYRGQVQRRAGAAASLADSAVPIEFVSALIEAAGARRAVFLAAADETLLERYAWEQTGELYRLLGRR